MKFTFFLAAPILFLAGGGTVSAATTNRIPPLPLAPSLLVNGLTLDPKSPPAGLVLREAIGLLTAAAVDGHVVHRTKTRVLETRAIKTPGGDYLLLFPEGEHYATAKGRPKVNTMIGYRSSDRGHTWRGPDVAFDIDYSQHGFVPLIPRGSKRIYAFGTQPVIGYKWENGQRENTPIGFRWSDDDGRIWSPVTLIKPRNDPGFLGMSVMRMTETDAGTWLIGSHNADWAVKPFTTRQYLLRSEDRGATWTVLPGPTPGGWFAAGFDRMDEGRPLNLGGGRVFFMSRTPEGHLWSARSTDDGKTWTAPAPTPLVHPDAPPMLFPLSDGKSLVAFHHNRTGETMSGPRSEIWCSTSKDEGRTWSEPRFVFANALLPNMKSSGFNHQCSYLDAFVDNGVLQIFFPHRWQQVVHVTIRESDLAGLPTRAQIAR
jgi:BNR repeat-like domain